jgi:hypothetical protein
MACCVDTALLEPPLAPGSGWAFSASVAILCVTLTGSPLLDVTPDSMDAGVKLREAVNHSMNLNVHPVVHGVRGKWMGRTAAYVTAI